MLKGDYPLILEFDIHLTAACEPQAGFLKFELETSILPLRCVNEDGST
jgi:hypothetical protein